MKLVLCVFFSIYFLDAYPLQTNPNIINIGLDVGITKTIVIDKMLNSQIYSSTSIKPVNFHFHFINDKNFNQVSIGLKKFTLKNDLESYDYNYLKYFNYSINYDYGRLIFNLFESTKIYAGFSYQGYIRNYDQYFNNNFYQYARGTKESYDVSLLNGFLTCIGNISKHDRSVNIVFNYSIINFGARPNDDYIKWPAKGFEYRWHSVNQYRSYRFMLDYTKKISSVLNFRSMINISYSKYLKDFGVKSFEQQFLIGISYVI